MVSGNGFIRYECWLCGHGGEGARGKLYPCHRCGHKYMTAKSTATKTTKATLEKLEKKDET